jgi:hypothetical protein
MSSADQSPSPAGPVTPVGPVGPVTPVPVGPVGPVGPVPLENAERACDLYPDPSNHTIRSDGAGLVTESRYGKSGQAR